MPSIRIAVAICFMCFLGCAAEHGVFTSPASDYEPSSMMVGETVVITAKPKFVRDGWDVDLIISDGINNASVIWSIKPGILEPNIKYFPVSLNKNQVYTFTVTQKPFYDSSISELQRVQLDGQTIYDIEACEVHQTKMAYKEVPILYGYITLGPDEPTYDEQQRLFPNSREVSFGGCVTTPSSPKSESIYVCEDCKEAYRIWELDRDESR